MHAYLIIHPSEKVREESLAAFILNEGIHRDDHHRIDPEEDTIGITAIRRMLASAARLKPIRSTHSLVSIPHAHLMTEEAQNALLKSLEEPTPSQYFFLGASHEHGLLPTILSRCARHPTHTEASSTPDPSIHELFALSGGAKMLARVDGTLNSRADAEALLRSLAMICRDAIAGTKAPVSGLTLARAARLARLSLTGLKMLAVNVNYRAVVDRVLLAF